MSQQSISEAQASIQPIRSKAEQAIIDSLEEVSVPLWKIRFICWSCMNETHWLYFHKNVIRYELGDCCREESYPHLEGFNPQAVDNQ